jgi:hypothetical protein
MLTINPPIKRSAAVLITIFFLLPGFAWPGVNFDVSSLTNRFITPNGDGLNDAVIATFDNPKDSAFSGQVFNTRGEVVLLMSPGRSVANSLQWDGKANGQAVASDLYYLKISAEGRFWTFIVLVFPMAENPIARNIPALTSQILYLTCPEASNAMNGLTATGMSDPVLAQLVGKTLKVIIHGADTGSVLIVGGAKGYVNPIKGEKLIIGFKATDAGTIKTKIFNGTGRLVREFSASTDGTQGGSLQWDGKDSGGNLVSSGVYLIHVEGPGINVTKRTVILK